MSFLIDFLTWSKYKCLVILSAAQLSGLGIPQGVLNSGANIKISCVVNTPTTGKGYGQQRHSK